VDEFLDLVGGEAESFVLRGGGPCGLDRVPLFLQRALEGAPAGADRLLVDGNAGRAVCALTRPGAPLR
jgi:hypothetical protein